MSRPRFLAPVLEQWSRKWWLHVTTVGIAVWVCVRKFKYFNTEYQHISNAKMMIKDRTCRNTLYLMVSIFPMEWLHRWASRCLLPFVDAKTVQKQHFKKGILIKKNFPNILMEFYCLCLARLNLPPAPGSAGQQAYHTNLGTWGQVFNPRGSRRHWPKEHVDLFGFLRALFSGPSLSTLAFFSTACPFPSPWVRGSQRQDQKERAPTRLHHLPELDVIIQTIESRLDEFNLFMGLPLVPIGTRSYIYW